VAHGGNYMELQYGVRATAISHWAGHDFLAELVSTGEVRFGRQRRNLPEEGAISRLWCRHSDVKRAARRQARWPYAAIMLHSHPLARAMSC